MSSFLKPKSKAFYWFIGPILYPELRSSESKAAFQSSYLGTVSKIKVPLIYQKAVQSWKKISIPAKLWGWGEKREINNREGMEKRKWNMRMSLCEAQAFIKFTHKGTDLGPVLGRSQYGSSYLLHRVNGHFNSSCSGLAILCIKKESH